MEVILTDMTGNDVTIPNSYPLTLFYSPTHESIEWEIYVYLAQPYMYIERNTPSPC